MSQCSFLFVILLLTFMMIVSCQDTDKPPKPIVKENLRRKSYAEESPWYLGKRSGDGWWDPGEEDVTLGKRGSEPAAKTVPLRYTFAPFRPGKRSGTESLDDGGWDPEEEGFTLDKRGNGEPVAKTIPIRYTFSPFRFGRSISAPIHRFGRSDMLDQDKALQYRWVRVGRSRNSWLPGLPIRSK